MMATENLLHNSHSSHGYGTIPNDHEQAGETRSNASGDHSKKQVAGVLSRFKTVTRCQAVILGIAFLFLTVSVAMLAGAYSAILSSSLRQHLVIREGSEAYAAWKSAPVPLQLKLYVFNLTNADAFTKGAKPIVEECGPYVWREYHEKQNLTFHPNDTVTFYQQRWWVWDQEASGNNSKDDLIVSLNTIPVAAVYSMRKSLLLPIISGQFGILGEKLTVTATVGEMLFDGFKDPVLDWVQKYVVPESGVFHFLKKFLEKKGGLTNFERFAWFYKRNMSLQYDGLFNMKTGADSLDNLGKIDLWNHQQETNFYKPPCNEVKGSAGELFPPNLERKQLVFFSSDLCMSATLHYQEEVAGHSGLLSYRYSGTDHTFANGTVVPGNECYCVDGTCAPTGLLNAESCRMGAPAYISFPHFYAADPFLLEGVDGLAPNKSKHAFNMDIIPELGVPAKVAARLQINIRVSPNSQVSLLSSVPDVYLPMLWFEILAEMPPEMSAKMKMLTFFIGSPIAKVIIWWVLIALSLVMAVVVIALVYWGGTYHQLP